MIIFYLYTSLASLKETNTELKSSITSKRDNKNLEKIENAVFENQAQHDQKHVRIEEP